MYVAGGKCNCSLPNLGIRAVSNWLKIILGVQDMINGTGKLCCCHLSRLVYNALQYLH